jgi:hypothetical protein
MDLAADVGGALGGLLDFLKPGKAKLVIWKDEKNKPEGPQELECMFNPTEYRISQGAEAHRTKSPTKPGGASQYKWTSPLTLSMQLFFDDFASAKGDVTPKITTLLGWQRPTEKSLKTSPAPPLVSFKWGNKQLDDFKGLITQLNITYTVFRRDGTPVQAKVDITITGDVELKKGSNPTSHAIDMRRVHTTVEGDTLQSVAYQELGKAEYWRALAELNGIDDPLRLRPGRALLIPSPSDVVGSA